MHCFVCGKIDNVKPFAEDSFEKCCRILAFRSIKKFMYGDLLLPPNSKEDAGYHMTCYRKFAVLNKKYIAEFENFVPPKPDTNIVATGDNRNTGQSSKNDDPQIGGHEAVETGSRDGYEGTLEMEVPSSTKSKIDTESTVSTNSEEMSPRAPSSTPIPFLSENIEVASVSYEASTILPTSAPASKPQVESGHPSSESVDTVKNLRTSCIFCSVHEKKVGRKRCYPLMCQSTDTLFKLKEMAEFLDDEKLLSKLQNPLQVAYHRFCYSAYRNKYVAYFEALRKSDEDPIKNLRQAHKKVFDSITLLIEEEIVKNEKIFYLVDLLAIYKAYFVDICGEAFKEDLESYTAQKLQDKILNAFGDAITIVATESSLKKRIVFKIDMNVSRLANESVVRESSEDMKFEILAYELRNIIGAMETKKLTGKITVEDILEGECEIPKKFYDFFRFLVQGRNARRKTGSNDHIKIESHCSDLIYSITNGRVKPAKLLTLGMAMKSMTSSRKVISILNRLGHSVSYNVVEELETEITFTAIEENRLIPAGISISEGLSTHLAFDNYDRFVNTTSGRDTLHDTVGIIYQFRNENPELWAERVGVDLNDESSSSGPRKRRKFVEISRDIQQTCRKPTGIIPLLSGDTILQLLKNSRNARDNAVMKDLLWGISVSRIEDVPMWVGFNASTTIDNSETQTVDYLAPINSSPTSLDVVQETLIRAESIRQQCQQSEIIVTYDLGIAKPAMQIQCSESPRFDNIFINVGTFHFEMAFFKALGKYIDSCGIVEMLIQSEVLAGGSINSFIDSKHFNRCKRLHPLISAALQALHFLRFATENELNTEKITESLKHAINTSVLLDEEFPLTPDLHEILVKYRRFCLETLSGEHGKTAQFYFAYVEFVNMIFRLSRSIRTSNFEMFANSTFEMIDLFFAMNQSNYARWSLKFLSNILNLKVHDSNLINEFKRGAFGVKRTKNCLARAPVDLTLEQTINADAANTATGVSHFTNSISARQRSALSHSMRTKIITHVLERVQLSRRDDVSYESQKARLQKDKADLQRIIDTIGQNVDPFDRSLDPDNLFNISTGRAASDEVANFLLKISETGSIQKMNFLKECEENPSRFDSPIKRNQIKNFASECMKKVVKNKDGSKQALLKMERDIFGRLLAISLEQNVEIEACLSYPLAPAPPALCQYNGEMHKTDKSTLAKALKSKIDPRTPPRFDVRVIDGFYLLHLIGSHLPQTFDKVSESILIKICTTTATEIHLIFDQYFTPSIKDMERRNRGEEDTPYTIVGPNQVRPNDFLKSLRNRKFKEALIKFLSENWAQNTVASIINEKKVFLTVNDKCYSFQVFDNAILKTEETQLHCEHEEADTRIIYHISKLENKSKVVVQASDTDVLIIILGNIHKLLDHEVWLLVAAKKTKGIEYMNCTELSKRLGSNLCKALPGFHAYTGCDFTAAFHRKGKIRPFKLLEKNIQSQIMFASLNSPDEISDKKKMSVLQEFTTKMYSVGNCKKVNAARFAIFQSMYSSKKNDEKFVKKIRGFDSSLIPPCWKSLQQKILRTIYVTALWQNATLEKNCLLNAEEHGWKLVNNRFEFKWFDGESTPLSVDDILTATVECDESNFFEDEVYSSDEEEV